MIQFLLFFFFFHMKNQDLLEASKNGNLETVKQILASKQFDINCQDGQDIFINLYL